MLRSAMFGTFVVVESAATVCPKQCFHFFLAQQRQVRLPDLPQLVAPRWGPPAAASISRHEFGRTRSAAALFSSMAHSPPCCGGDMGSCLFCLSRLRCALPGWLWVLGVRSARGVVSANGGSKRASDRVPTDDRGSAVGDGR